MAEVRNDSKGALDFLALENMRVEYLMCDVKQVVEMRHFKILCKGSQQNQLKSSFKRKVGQIV